MDQAELLSQGVPDATPAGGPSARPGVVLGPRSDVVAQSERTVNWESLIELRVLMDIVSDLYTDRRTGNVYTRHDRDGYVEAECHLPVIRSERGPHCLTMPVRVRVPLGVLADRDWRWVLHSLLGERASAFVVMEHPWIQGHA